MSPCARWAGSAWQSIVMVLQVPLPVLWHMVVLPWHGGTVEVGPAVTTRVAVPVAAGAVEVRVADAATVVAVPVGGAVVRVGDGCCTVADGLGQAPPPPGSPVMVSVYAGHPAFAVTSLTTIENVALAGTLNE
jgi:hypothetical protein